MLDVCMFKTIIDEIPFNNELTLLMNPSDVHFLCLFPTVS